MEEKKKNMNLTKTNWELAQSIIDFRGAASATLPDPIFEWMKQACANAKDEAKKTNHTLLGHIQEEYSLKEISGDFLHFIHTQCLGHENIKDYLNAPAMQVIPENRPFYVDKMWVNYMKKHEFNPPHRHSGLFSFVVFVKIPYDLKEEEAYFKDVKIEPSANTQFTSKFAFLNPDYTGSIRVDCLPVDKSFEGKIIFFKASQIHQVFPFYTSDGYRITASGNIRLKV